MNEEVDRWKKLSQQQRVLLKAAGKEIKRLRELEHAVVLYANEYGFVTEVADGTEISEGVDLFNKSVGYRPPGKVKRFKVTNEN